MPNRRSFLGCASALLTPSIALEAQPAAALSRSVLSATEASVKQLHREAHARRLTARSVRRAHTSLAIFFDHLDETGHTARLQKLLHAQGLDSKPLDYDQLALLRTRYTAATGEPVTDTQFQALVENNDRMWPKMHALLEAGGVQSVRAHILGGLENGADRIEQDERSGIARARMGARLRPVQDYGQYQVPYAPETASASMSGWDICAAIGLAGVYVGTWGVMDAVAAVSIFAIGPLGWALIGLFFAVAGAVCL